MSSVTTPFARQALSSPVNLKSQHNALQLEKKLIWERSLGVSIPKYCQTRYNSLLFQRQGSCSEGDFITLQVIVSYIKTWVATDFNAVCAHTRAYGWL